MKKQERYESLLKFFRELECKPFDGSLTIEECAELLVYGYVCQ